MGGAGHSIRLKSRLWRALWLSDEVPVCGVLWSLYLPEISSLEGCMVVG